jgi:O-antigen/teichoic acid export membrane protein
VVHNVAAGYAVLAATTLYSLASVPLALHYLSEERFGLWALMSSIGGYLSLVDLGMTGSVSRLLIDHKDRRDGGTYGSMILTGWLVLSVQGATIWIVGSVIAPMLAGLLDIPSDLRAEFVGLLRWHCLSVALGFGFRIFNQVLYAHQRIDVFNCVQIATLAAGFALQWILFQLGQGVFSLVWSALATGIGGGLALAIACWRFRLLPAAGCWGRGSWRYFKELLSYGKDLFLIAVGGQLINASQMMIITRMLGLKMAACWAVGTKMLNLVSFAVWRIWDASAPAFSEMMVRGEWSILRDRYKATTALTASLSGFAVVLYVLCNTLFVTIWTHGKFSWFPAVDVLLGAWMVITALLRCHNTLVTATKEIHFMRYVYFLEGLAFVITAVLTVRVGGLLAVVGCSVVCSLLFTYSYGVWRISRYFQLSASDVGFCWLAPLGSVLLRFVPIALATWWGCRWIREPVLRLTVHAATCGPIGLCLFLRYGLPQSLQGEVLARAPRWLSLVLRRVFHSQPQA